MAMADAMFPGRDGAGDGPHVGTQFQDYPKHKPFLNSTYRYNNTHHTINSFPESHRDAVMLALKDLQDKIRQLEKERTQAQSTLRAMNRETDQYNSNGQSYGNRYTAVKSKLENTEQRCSILERELSHTRRLLQDADRDRSEASARVRDQKENEIRRELRKMEDLERQQRRLATTQHLAEMKIVELEENLQEEKRLRKLTLKKAAEMESEVITNKILADAEKRNSKKTVKTRRRSKSAAPEEPDSDHYRLNIGDIPFVAGKAITPSHALGANFQHLIALMKNHNPKLCRSASLNGHCTPATKPKSAPVRRRQTSADCDLEELLLQLQDEYARLGFSHRELNQLIMDCSDPRLRADLEHELEDIVSKMEAKGDQIARLRRMKDKKAKKKSSVKKGVSQQTAKATVPVNGEIQIVTTVRSKSAAEIPLSGRTRAEASKNIYKNVKKIQSRLEKDDLSWE